MNDLELIFTMLGEASTTKIARKKDAQGFTENERAAQEGGFVAGVARRELESRSGEKVVSDENYLYLAEKKMKKQIKVGRVTKADTSMSDEEIDDLLMR